ncbi:MAG TPA: hypothetical protein VF342_06760 [Alphaproteobacteria bacterium]
MRSSLLLSVATLVTAGLPALAADITASKGNDNVRPAFDIVRAAVRTSGDDVVFRIEVAGVAGSEKPAPVGKTAGSDVYSYVWPTTIDSAAVGFEPNQGILALAVTAHPDFDDTPASDESGDGNTKNDGALWHSHWVVLVKDDACGAGALKVKDIPQGTSPRLPPTWPGLPILIDSPDYRPQIGANTVEVRVPLSRLGTVREASYDGVTAGLRVNANMHAPLLCVVDVFDVASGDLSLPGKVE